MLEILDTAGTIWWKLYFFFGDQRTVWVGTEQFTAMRELYIKDAQGYLLIYSITSSGSFVALGDLHKQIVEVRGTQNVSSFVQNIWKNCKILKLKILQLYIKITSFYCLKQVIWKTISDSLLGRKYNFFLIWFLTIDFKFWKSVIFFSWYSFI